MVSENISPLNIPPPAPALWIACRIGISAEVCKLIAKGADLNERGGAYNSTPLIVACEFGHVDVIELLLDNGANKEDLDDRGMASVHIVVAKNNFDVLRLLLTRGADPNSRMRPFASMKPHARSKSYARFKPY